MCGTLGMPEPGTSAEAGRQDVLGRQGSRAGAAHHDIMSLHLCLLAHQFLTFQLQAAKSIHGFHPGTHISCPIPLVLTFHPTTSASSARLPPAPTVSRGHWGVSHPLLSGVAIPGEPKPLWLCSPCSPWFNPLNSPVCPSCLSIGTLRYCHPLHPAQQEETDRGWSPPWDPHSAPGAQSTASRYPSA